MTLHNVTRSRFLATLGSLGVFGAAARANAALPPWFPLPPPLRPKLPDRGLVLSGAGARGAYEAGVLKWLFRDLDRAGPPYDVICGSSAGAINAAFAARATSNAIAQVERFWLDLPQANVLRLVPPAEHAANAAEAFRQSTQHGYPRKLVYLSRANRELDAMGPKEKLIRLMGVVSSAGIDGLMRRNPMTLAQVRTSLIVTATNLTRFSSDAFYCFRGSEAEAQTRAFLERAQISGLSEAASLQATNLRFQLTEDNLAKAVLASTAVPGVFAPVEVPLAESSSSDLFVDGGVANNTPVSTIVGAGANDVTVVLASAPNEGREKVPESMPELFLASFAVIQRELFEDDVRLALAKNLLSRYRDFRGLSRPTVEYLQAIQTAQWRPIKLKIIRPAKPLELSSMGFNDATNLRAAFEQGYADAQQPAILAL